MIDIATYAGEFLAPRRGYVLRVYELARSIDAVRTDAIGMSIFGLEPSGNRLVGHVPVNRIVGHTRHSAYEVA